MKKMYIKYKVLVNGLNPKKKYAIDGFTLREGTFEKQIFTLNRESDMNKMCLNMNIYLISCLTDYNKLTYNYLESDDYKEIEVSNKTSKNTLDKVLKNNKNIINDILNLEQKIRIIFNIPVLFQSINVEFYDQKKEYIGLGIVNKPISYWNRLEYNLNPEEFQNNSRFKMNIDSMKNTNNNYFNRALEFYNDSFDSEKITNRYILIFSSLEAIFNLSKKDVSKKISRYSAKLLAEEDENKYDKIYKDIKRLYDKRCKYIHGSKTNIILDEDEKLLRKYVRRIIIAYWYIILITKKSSKEILKYLDSNEKLDLQVRLLIAAITSDNFSRQQYKIVDIIEKEIPDNKYVKHMADFIRTSKRGVLVHKKEIMADE